MRVGSRWIALSAMVLLAASAGAQTITLLSADYGIEGNRMDVTCRVQSMVQNGYLHFQVSNYALGGDPAPDLPKELRIRARDYRGRIFDFSRPEMGDVDMQVTDSGPNCPKTAVTSQWHGRLTDDDQRRFDSYYTRWLGYRQHNDQDEIASMQKRMYDVYYHYGIPNNVPFDQVASAVAVSSSGGGYSDLQIVSATYGIPQHTRDVTARLRGMVKNSSLSVHVNNDSMGGDPAPEKHKVLTLTYSYRGQQRTITARESDDLSLP